MQATIAAGAKLIGDDALAKEMTPPRSFDIFEETQAWRQSHPYPKSDDPPEKKRAYAEAALEIAATWIAQAPERIGGYSERLHALEMLDAPVEQIARRFVGILGPSQGAKSLKLWEAGTIESGGVRPRGRRVTLGVQECSPQTPPLRSIGTRRKQLLRGRRA
jgi:hypothetical protein